MSERARKERNPEETKARILRAAGDEFGHKGFGGARLRAVAREAGVHHALLHHYFGDKVGLFRAVVETAFERVSTEAFEAMRHSSDFRRLLPAYVSLMVDFHAENPNLARMLHFAALDPEREAHAVCVRITKEIGAPLMEAISRALAEAQASGQVRDDIDAKRLLALAMGAVAYVFQHDRFFAHYLGAPVHDREQAAAHRDAAIQFVEAALQPAAPGA